VPRRKPLRRAAATAATSASGHCRPLGGKAQWRPDEAVCRAAHLVTRALRPPATAAQSRCPSSFPPSASVEDTDDDDDDVDDGGGGLWQRGRRNPTVVTVIIIVDDNGDYGNERIVEAEQWGRTTEDVVSPTPSSAARFVICRFHHRAIVNTSPTGRRPLSPTFASRCPIHHLRRSRRWLVVAFPAHPAAYQLSHQAEHVFMFPHLDIF